MMSVKYNETPTHSDVRIVVRLVYVKLITLYYGEFDIMHFGPIINKILLKIQIPCVGGGWMHVLNTKEEDYID